MAKLTSIEGIGGAYLVKLASAGVSSTTSLLEKGATRSGRQALAKATGVSEKIILRWINHADLFRVKGVAGQYAELLEAAGVDSVPELARRNAANLREQLATANSQRALVRQLPTLADVASWVAHAQTLPRAIEY